MEIAQISTIFGMEKRETMEEGNCAEDNPESISDNVSNEDGTNHQNKDTDNTINQDIPVYISYASEDESKQSFTKTKKG